MGKQWKQWQTLFFWSSKITAVGECSHEIKRRLLFGRKAMTNLDSILKSRDITLSTKVRLVKAMVSPVVVYGCESWTIKKAECWRIDVFELWCWRWLLSIPWTARRSNQSILKKINPENSLGGLMLKLNLWPPDAKSWLIRENPDAGKDWRQEEKGTIEDEMVEWHHWLDGREFEKALRVDDGQGSLACCSPWGCKELDTTEWLNWTEPIFWASQVALVVKNLLADAGDTGSIPGSGRSPGEGHGNPLQYSCLENPMDRGAWWTTFHRVAKSWMTEAT